MAEQRVKDLSGRVLGDFVLRQRIGAGGHAVVYRCEQPALQRDAVVKVLRENDTAGRQRFLREALLASQLDHPYAAHVYAFGAEEDGLLWIAMELVQGEDLEHWLETLGPVPLDQFVPFFECVAQVVQAAHDRGIVHRDLKPSNIMVIERDGRLYPKLLDFGIAIASPSRARREEPTKPLGRRVTRAGAGIGSPPYMPPEQWSQARSVGRAADIYALGVVAYEALSGRLPFDASDTAEMHKLHRSAEVPALGIPAIDQILRRALSKQPEDRHHDVMELAAELRTALSTQPREQLRSAAQQWADRGRAGGLLWLPAEVRALERGRETTTPKNELSELECSFLVESQRRARRLTWLRRAVLITIAILTIGGVEIRATVRAEVAEQVASAAELEQGRQALLHGESADAVEHLEHVYEHGERSPATEFMLARARQPLTAEIVRLTASSKRMRSAIFSPDGRRILTTDDRAARAWDAQSGRLLFEMPHGDVVFRASYSPDGTKIVTASADGTVRIWDASTGAPIKTLAHAGAWRYYGVRVASHFVAAIDVTGRAAHVWDASTGALVAELPNDGSELALLSFSPSAQWLATSGGGVVHVYDTTKWCLLTTLGGPRVQSMAWAPSSDRLAIGTFDGAAAIWDLAQQARTLRLRAGGESVDAVAFSPDGRRVATGSRDGAEQVWDAVTGGLVVESNTHRSKIYTLEFSPTGDQLLSAGADHAAAVWDVATGMSVTRLEGPSSLLIAAHFDSSGQRVVGASWDGTARVWSARSPYLTWRSPTIGPACDTMDSLEPDRRIVAIACPGSDTKVWNTGLGEQLVSLPEVTRVSEDGFYSALPAVSTVGDRAAIARGNTVEMYALPDGQLIQRINHDSAVNAVAFGANDILVSGDVRGGLMLTKADGASLALPPTAAGIDAVAILPDGRVIAADRGLRLRVIDPRHAGVDVDVRTASRVRLLRVSPNGAHLVTIATRDSELPPTVWNLDRMTSVELHGHVGRVFSARWLEDGRIITAGSDGTARMWGVDGSQLQVYRGDSHFFADAMPYRGMILAGGSDGNLWFWDADSGRLLWKLPAHKSYVVGIQIDAGDIVTRSFFGELAHWHIPQLTEISKVGAASAAAR